MTHQAQLANEQKQQQISKIINAELERMGIQGNAYPSAWLSCKVIVQLSAATQAQMDEVERFAKQFEYKEYTFDETENMKMPVEDPKQPLQLKWVEVITVRLLKD